MAAVYFDASALVKLLVDESGSELVAELWDTVDVRLSSRIAYAEVCAALAAAGRNHDLPVRTIGRLRREWDGFWAAVRPVELTAAVERRAGDLAARHALRGSDAVHLASALAIGDPDVVVAVWDRRLHAGAVAAGLIVAPLDLPT